MSSYLMWIISFRVVWIALNYSQSHFEAFLEWKGQKSLFVTLLGLRSCFASSQTSLQLCGHSGTQIVSLLAMTRWDVLLYFFCRWFRTRAILHFVSIITAYDVSVQSSPVYLLLLRGLDISICTAARPLALLNCYYTSSPNRPASGSSR